MAENDAIWTKEEVDNYMAEKVNEIKEQVSQEAKEQIESLQEQIKEKEQELAEKEEKIKNEQKKELDWRNLRKKAEGSDKLEGEIQELKEQIMKVSQSNQQEIIDEFVTDQVGAVEDDKKLFNHYFKMLGQKATTKTEIKKALDDAMILFSKDKGKVYDPMKKVIQTNANPQISVGDGKYEKESFKDMASKFGVTDEDIKKYGDGKVKL